MCVKLCLKKPKSKSQVVLFCFSRSSRIASLINCDFCPLVFHQDCLTPPLAQEPIGLWLCPNHPENFEVGVIYQHLTSHPPS